MGWAVIARFPVFGGKPLVARGYVVVLPPARGSGFGGSANVATRASELPAIWVGPHRAKEFFSNGTATSPPCLDQLTQWKNQATITVSRTVRSRSCRHCPVIPSVRKRRRRYRTIGDRRDRETRPKKRIDAAHRDEPEPARAGDPATVVWRGLPSPGCDDGDQDHRNFQRSNRRIRRSVYPALPPGEKI